MDKKELFTPVHVSIKISERLSPQLVDEDIVSSAWEHAGSAEMTE